MRHGAEHGPLIDLNGTQPCLKRCFVATGQQGTRSRALAGEQTTLSIDKVWAKLLAAQPFVDQADLFGGIERLA